MRGSSSPYLFRKLASALWDLLGPWMEWRAACPCRGWAKFLRGLGASAGPFSWRSRQPSARRPLNPVSLALDPVERRILLSAVVETDKPDYAPGSTALFTTGADAGPAPNFLVGETLRFRVARLDGAPITAPAVEQFQVTDGAGNFTPYQDAAGAWCFPDLDSRSDGTVLTAWAVDPQFANAALTLSVTGLQSGATAFTTFTDSATLTSASGGTGISADKARNSVGGGEFTTLGNIIIKENLNGDFSTGTGRTLILNAPANWEFNPDQGSVSFTAARDLANVSWTVSATAVTLTFDIRGTAGQDQITISGLQVQALSGAILTGVNITRSGTANIAGVTTSTNFGTLSQAAGAAAKLGFTAGPIDVVAGAPLSSIIVKVQDQFGNLLSAPNGTVTMALENNPGGATLSGVTTRTTTNGSASFTGLSLDKVGTGYTLRASIDGLTSAISPPFNVLAPGVTGVSSTAADGPYGSGSIPITVTFNRPILVTGFPQLALNSGGTAIYSGGSGTTTLTFTYTISSGDSAADVDYASVAALTLNGGTLQDAAANDASLLLPAPGSAGSLAAAKNLVIDTAGPTFSVTGPVEGNYYNDSVTIRGTATDNLAGVKAVQVSVRDNATNKWFVSSTGFSSDVEVRVTALGTNTWSWVLGNSRMTSGHTYSVWVRILDEAGNITPSASPITFTFDNTPPVLESLTRHLPGDEITNGSTVTYLATFSEPVKGVSAANFAVTSPGGGVTIGSPASADGGLTWTIEVGNLGLVNGIVILKQGTKTGILDVAGNAPLSGTLTGQAYTLDHIAPTGSVSYSGILGPDGWYTTQGNLEIVSGDANGIASVTYTIDSGDPQAYAAAFAFGGEGAHTIGFTITDHAGNQFSGSAPVNINLVAPGVNSIMRVGDENTSAASVSWTVTFSEAVTGVAASSFALAQGGDLSGTAIIALVPVSGAVYTVTASTGTGDGTLGLDLVDGGTIADMAGTPLGIPSFTGQRFTVFHPAAPTATVALDTATPTTHALLTATATRSDPSATLTYIWKVNGIVRQSTVRNAHDDTDLTDTFDLAQPGNGSPGDAVTVEVIPDDGILTGETVSDAATVIKSIALVNVLWAGGTYSGLAFEASGSVVGVGGDDLGTPTFTYHAGETAGAALAAAPVAAGTYTVIAYFGGNAEYEAGSSEPATITIAKAASTTEVVWDGWTYDATAHAAAAGVAGPGTLAGEPTIQYYRASDAARENPVPEPIDAGAYTAVATYAGDDNHTSSLDWETITVAPRAISITADPQQKLVGHADPALTYQMMAGTLAGADAFTGVLSREPGEGIGVYAITQGSLALSANYTLAFIGANFTIAPLITTTITLTWDDSTYNGEANAASAPVSAPDGFSATATLTYHAGGDTTGTLLAEAPTDAGIYTVVAAFEGDATHAASSITKTIAIARAQATIVVNGYAGTYDGAAHRATGGATGVESTPADLSSLLDLGEAFTNVGDGTAQWTFAGDGNYLPATGTVAITLLPAPVTVAVTGGNFTYNGNVHTPAGSAVTGAGGLATIATSFTYADAQGNPLGEAPVDAGTYRVIAHYTGDTNHLPGSSEAATLIIDKANATLLVSGFEGIYDGLAHQATGSVTGVLGEDLSGLLDLGEAFTNVPGGTATWTFAGNANYHAATGTTRITITPATTATTVTWSGWTYDGTAHAALISVTGDGILTGEIALTYFLSTDTEHPLAAAPVNAGSYTVVAAYPGDVNHAASSATETITVSLRPVIVRADDKVKMKGDADPLLSYQLTQGSLVGSDAFTGTLQRAGGEEVGTYAITQGSLALNANYSLTFIDGALTITEVPLVATTTAITWSDAMYAGAPHEATATVTAEDGFNVPAALTYYLGTDATGTRLESAPVNAGTYTVVADFAGDATHAPSSAMRTITIEKAAATIIIVGFAGPYDGLAHGAAGSATGVETTPADLSSLLTFGDSFVDVPGGTAAWTFAGNANYLPASGTVAITIFPAATTITLIWAGWTYDGTAHEASATMDTSGDITVRYYHSSDTLFEHPLPGAPVDAGRYTVIAAYAGDGNHATGSATEMVTVAPRAVTVQADDQVKVEGETDPALTYRLTDGTLFGSDGFEGALERAPGETPGTYTIAQGSLALNANYTMSFVPGTLTISKVPLLDTTTTITWGDATYTGAPHAATAIVTAAGGFSVPATLTYYVGADATGTRLDDAPVNAGTYTLVATFDGDDTHAPSSATQTITIARAAATLHITGFAGAYDGQPHSASGTAAGVEESPADLNALLHLGDSFVDVPGGTAVWTFDGNANYLPAGGTVTITITPAATTTTLTWAGWTYDAIAHEASATVDSGGSAAIDYYLSGDTLFEHPLPGAPADAGSYTAVARYGGDANHEASSDIRTITVSPRDLTIAAQGATKVYGSVDPALGYDLTGGVLVGGDAITGEPARSPGEDAGTYAILQGTLSAGPNYTLTFEAANFIITPASTTTTVAGGVFTYDALAHGGGDVIVAGPGAITGDIAIRYYAASDIALEHPLAGAPVGAGSYLVVATYAGDGNHAGSAGSAAITIMPRAISVAADPQAKMAGEADPPLTYKIIEGTLAGGDAFIGAPVRAAGEAAGIYAITQGSLTLGDNYQLSFTNAALTITAHGTAITITWDAWTYDGAAHAATAIVTGAGGLHVPAILDYFAGSDDTGTVLAGAPVHAGTYTVRATFAGDATHAPASATMTLTVAKAAPTIVVLPYAAEYTGLPQAALGSVVGILGEPLAGLDLSGTIHTDAGTYAADGWTFTDATGDYLDAAGTIENLIEKAVVVVTVEGGGFTYDGAAHGAAATGVAGAGGLATTATGVSYFASDGTPLAAAPVNAGLYTVVAHYAGDANHRAGDSAPAPITIAPRLLTAAATAENKTYDGTVAAVVGLSGDALPGDTVMLTCLAAHFASRQAGLGKTVTVAGLAISGPDAANYVLAGTQVSTTANILRRAITASIAVEDKIYDGSVMASIALRSLSGAIEGDTVTSTGGSAVFADPHAGTDKQVTASGLILAGDDAANYTVNDSAVAVATIRPRAITVTAAPDTKTYDGTLASAAAPIVSAGTLAAGDAADFTQAYINRNVGTGKMLVITGGGVQDGNGGNNYNVTLVGGAHGVILPRTLHVSGLTAADKVYDRTATATLDLGAASLANGVAGDLVSLVTDSATAAFLDVHAAVDKPVSVAGLLISGDDAGNYTLASPVLSATIRPAALTLAATADVKVYDGTTASTAAPSVSGLIAGDQLSGLAQAFDSRHAGSEKILTISAFAVDDGNSGMNYAVTLVPARGTTEQATLTLAATADIKTYDGTLHSNAAPAVAGLQQGDDVTGLLQAYTHPHAGGDKMLTITAYTLEDGNGGNNYRIQLAASHAGMITPATLTLSAFPDSKIYDGTTASSVLPLVSGLQGTDTVTALLQAFDTPDAGDDKTLAVIGYTLADGNEGRNYTVVAATAKGAVSPKAITVAGAAVAAKIYDGTTAAELQLAAALLEGVVAADAGMVSLDARSALASFVTRHAGKAILVDVSGLTLAGEQARNYRLLQPVASADILPRTITLTAVADGKIYDGTPTSGATPSVDGLQPGDTLTDLVQAFDNANAGSEKTILVSTYLLDDGNAGANYQVITIGSHAGIITPRALGVAGITALSKTYDGSTAAALELAEATLTGVLGDDEVTLISADAAGTFDTRNAGVGRTVTISGLLLAGAEASNYSVSAAVTADISPLAITGAVTVHNKPYDGTTSAVIAGYQLTGVLAGDDVILAGGTAAFDTRDPGLRKTVTATGLVLTGEAAGNYTLLSTTAATTADILASTVLGRHLFYKGSTFNTAEGSFIGALAIDKTALLPGGTATFSNISSFDRGINGIAVDISGTILAMTPADFVFRVGNDSSPEAWAEGPSPTAIFLLAIAGGTRVEITFDDHAIENCWLQVTLRSGLASDDVFYFGNAIGESGDAPGDARVTILDALAARANPAAGAAIDNPYDYNRDGAVDGMDTLVAAKHLTNLFNRLQLIDAPEIPEEGTDPAALPQVTLPESTAPEAATSQAIISPALEEAAAPLAAAALPTTPPPVVAAAVETPEEAPTTAAPAADPAISAPAGPAPAASTVTTIALDRPAVAVRPIRVNRPPSAVRSPAKGETPSRPATVPARRPIVALFANFFKRLLRS